jgi:lipopolysaccharide transport system ATP-binding protein
VWIPGNLLNAGSYFISSAIFNHLENAVHFHEHQLLRFTIQEVFEEQTARGMSGGDFPGVIRPLLNWTIKTP